MLTEVLALRVRLMVNRTVLTPSDWHFFRSVELLLIGIGELSIEEHCE